LQQIENSWKQGRVDEITAYTNAVEAEKKEQWRAEGQKDLFAAKRENVALQLEAAYRERLMTAFSEVCCIEFWKVVGMRLLLGGIQRVPCTATIF
jgi:F-type H+-transporting ATPase subunit b